MLGMVEDIDKQKAFEGSSEFGHQQDPTCRQLAVKNAMQSRRNLNITAYTPQQPPQQPGKIRDKVTTEEKVEAGTAGSAV